MAYNNIYFMKKIYLLFLALGASLSAYIGNPRLDILCGPDRLSIGPEVYYIDKVQDMVEFGPGEEKHHHKISQEGWMYGERISYDRLRCNALYYGADQYYAVGCIGRCTKFGKHPTRQMKDAEVEGRIGYTLGLCWPCNAYFTPIVGFGNYNGQERYKKPVFKKHQKHKKNKRITFTNRPRFNFISTGFLSGVFLNNCSSIGVNFKAKFMTSGKNKIEWLREERECEHDCDCHHHHSDDDCHHHNHCKCECKKKKKSICQDMNKRTQYQVDIPMTYYNYCTREQEFEMSVIPFYRLRRYGGKDNFPLDFPETTFHMVGVRFMLTYLF